jgi:hypothetical protein
MAPKSKVVSKMNPCNAAGFPEFPDMVKEFAMRRAPSALFVSLQAAIHQTHF